jgi:hypothetical protein
MKKVLSCTFSVVLVLCLNTPGNSAYAAESSAPTIDSCSFTPHALSDATGGILTVTLHITAKNGLVSPVFALINLIGDEGRHLAGSPISLVSGDNKSGIWSQKIAVKPNLAPGKYNLTFYPLFDSQQNSTLGFINCPGEELIYGIVTSSDPTPTPTLKGSITPSPASSLIPDSQFLQKQLGVLSNQVNSLQNKVEELTRYQKEYFLLKAQIKRICTVRRKPPGCSK